MYRAPFEWIYQRLERLMIALDPVFARIGYDRVERPIALVEYAVKGLLFDCQMCGQCVLSSTGMSCPMTCPKQLRNGPCGGVRPGGYCEIRPQMKCAWCLAWDGAARMKGGDKIREVLPPVDRSLKGSSAWLRVSREKAAKLRESEDAAKTTVAMAFPAARKNEPSTAPLAPEPPRAVDQETRR
jgi:hypothetical protein